MQTATTTEKQPSDSQAGNVPPSKSGKSRDLLTRADYGLHVTGRIDSITPVEHREGKSQAGNEYSFYQQTVTLALGGSMVEVVYRADKAPNGPLCSLELDDAVRIKVEKPRIFNGRVSFDAVVI